MRTLELQIRKLTRVRKHWCGTSMYLRKYERVLNFIHLSLYLVCFELKLELYTESIGAKLIISETKISQLADLDPINLNSTKKEILPNQTIYFLCCT